MAMRVLRVESRLPAELEGVTEARSNGSRKRPAPGRETPKLEVTAGGERFARFLYVKQHGNAEEGEHALFVANVGLALGERELKTVFSSFGKLERVEIGEARTCRFARVYFAEAKGLRLALERASADGTVDDEEAIALPEERASKRTAKPAWLVAYDEERPGNAVLKEQSEEYMQAFARLEAEETERRKRMEQEADDDGFTMVTYSKGSKARPAAAIAADKLVLSNGTRQHMALLTGSTANLNRNSKKKSRGHDDFYRFQKREKKRDQLAELRDKFEQDKEHLERMKSARRFKPF